MAEDEWEREGPQNLSFKEEMQMKVIEGREVLLNPLF